MKRFGRCQVLSVLLVILTIGIDESEEVSAVVEDRNGDSTTTTTVNVDNPTDCDKVFLIIVTGSGLFNYVIATGNIGGAFTTATDTDSGDEKLQCNMATIRTNAIASYSLSITVTDTGDSSTDTRTVTVIVENLVIPSVECDQVPSVPNGSIVGGDQSPYAEGQNVTYSCTTGYTINGTAKISCNGSGVWSEPPSCLKDIGSSCSSDAECRITLHTPPYVCDNTVCKFGVGGRNCTDIANSCLTNGRCTSGACECVDGFDSVDNKCYKLILSSPKNGSVIEICETTEINEVIANLSASFAPTSTDFMFKISDPSKHFSTADETITVVSDLDVDVETPVTSYVLIIELSHPNSSRTVSSTITISVEDDNDNAPEFGKSIYTFNISENFTASKAVGTITATDKDSTSPNNMIATYTVFGTSKFKITPEGVLMVLFGASFNYITTPFYTFLVMATDGGEEDMELSTNVSVTVNVKPGSWCSSDEDCTGILSSGSSFVCDNSKCKSECSNDKFGENCEQICPCNMTNTDICDKVTGNCLCKRTWTGTTCNDDIDECSPTGSFLNPCVIKHHTVCENTIGNYTCNCITGYQKDAIGCVECPRGQFGENCAQTCPCNMTNTEICDKVDGNCQCKPSWKGATCNEDVDECNPAGPFLNPCVIKEHTVCANTNGNYECNCITGYQDNAIGCVLTTALKTTSATNASMIAYLAGGVGGGLFFIVGVVCVVFFVWRRKRAVDDECKRSLSQADSKAKEGQEYSDLDGPQNVNDIQVIEINQYESLLSVAEMRAMEARKNSSYADPKEKNDINSLEMNKYESPLSATDYQATEYNNLATDL
ncbi:uncharacterized protein LOC128211861 isoform X2 [Mya arenaria]|uniref:uncharacterized protein LOC128211861 isoform X2 n=1 Tax=Mya arenaria TaxID=6604 RepID=UPI0022E4754B|nr:uncharacterized protein LOC128211861 isoform X2 [Mya arenaria]